VVVAERKSAEQRRDEILDAAMIEFAQRGLEGASTEDIAKRAGISQPYVFRLFGTKKELFKATAARCLRETLEIFQRAAEGKRGEEALKAMGEAYRTLLEDRSRLRAQMQSYAACDDPEICAVVRAGYGDIVTYVERVSGADRATVSTWFAKGMLMNVIASMDLLNLDEPWAERLIAGCVEAK
jgi:AcrR family transcriptional regulator